MSRKKLTLFASSIIAVVTGVVLCHAAFQSHSLPIPAESPSTGKEKVESLTASSMNGKRPSSSDIVINPWDDHRPLTTEERREFESAETQIRQFISWGKMDPEAIPAFRQTLFKLGDRAVADLARELSQITRDDIPDKAAAEELVKRIDVLAYFADSSNPLAAASIAAMAKRPVNWNDAGELLHPIEANITFEMFDIFAKTRPSEAAVHISTIEKNHRPAYFTRYAYGRKLAGKTMEDIDLELRAVFGSPELAFK